MTLCLGIDPDLHTTGIALVELLTDYSPGVPQTYYLRWCGTARVGPQYRRGEAVAPMARAIMEVLRDLWILKMLPVERIVVESQQMYAGVGRSPPADLICLAQVAGAAVGAACSSGQEIEIPVPRKWGGQVPKGTRHDRLAGKVVGFEMCRNEHERDAVGLAVWGLTQGAIPAGSPSSRSAGAT